MNAVSPIRPVHATTFHAWRIPASTTQAYPLDTEGAQTLADAVNAAAPRCNHKDALQVLHTNGKGERLLVVYAIKQGAPTYRKCPDKLIDVRFVPLKPVELYRVAVEDFAPVEPWSWSPGADPVGLNRGLVEVRGGVR
ncbi:hypothetical protein [Novosphingobium olei]|uniref:Uncharacterized protein n=1 Tax=Novosphingobium olei TaxID=2728851 RepID=A0A7Y0GAM5_9SPHN|nr:hypothetical protein [Novosphingobium olei]NML93772.1 hypothetical protein [Novosphingobium olei]